MKIQLEDFLVQECLPESITEILQIQDETFRALPCPDFLRKNTPEMLLECLNRPNYTIGAWYNGELAAFAVFYDPGANSIENLSLYLKDANIAGIKPANFKLCMVRDAYRGNSLQFYLGMLIEQYAVNAGVGLICATVHPKNIYSVNNLVKLGYTYNCTLKKYGSERNLYFKFI